VLPGVSFSEMQELYALADVYVHGGKEPASTALVIGAISHLPLISSLSVGCAADVVRDGETGVLLTDCLSVDGWVAAFRRMMSDSDRWGDYGINARIASERLDCDNTIENLISVIKNVGRTS